METDRDEDTDMTFSMIFEIKIVDFGYQIAMMLGNFKITGID
jgi:hypothetical protein